MARCLPQESAREAVVQSRVVIAQVEEGAYFRGGGGAGSDSSAAREALPPLSPHANILAYCLVFGRKAARFVALMMAGRTRAP